MKYIKKVILVMILLVMVVTVGIHKNQFYIAKSWFLG